MNIADIKLQLTNRRSELTERVGRIHKNIHHRDEPLSADFAEQAVELENREVLEALDDDAKVELRQIERALQRIEQDEYAHCESCGEEIGTARLEALPYTTTCIRCATAREAAESRP